MAVGASPRRLEAALAVPSSPPRAAAVVCHPHPEYGGDMDNPVVTAIADALAADGVAALRFNFGGVGRSQGGYGGGPAEVRDVRAAVDALGAELAGLPLAIVGYSFGAWVGTLAATEGAPVARVVAVAPPIALAGASFGAGLGVPLAVVVGDRDQFCPLAGLAGLGAPAERTIVVGADHFFAGREAEVAAAVVAFFR